MKCRRNQTNVVGTTTPQSTPNSKKQSSSYPTHCKAYPVIKTLKWTTATWLKSVVVLLSCLGMTTTLGFSQPISTGKASYYTLKSVTQEGNSGITASGEKFNEDSLTAAMRSREWNKTFKVTNLQNGKSVVVRINDFGPGKGPSSKGVIIDLSKAAFEEIADLKEGIIKVSVEPTFAEVLKARQYERGVKP